MKNTICFLALFTVLSCVQKEQSPPKENVPVTFANADTSSNDVIHMKDLQDNYVQLEELIQSLNGKVVYLDIWASWCGPCKAMMPASHKLQETYKGKDVVFLYVSIDRNEDAWRRGSAQFKLTENSYLAKNYPKAQLFQTHNVRTIPRYMLFDKTGRLVDSDAQRPVSALLKQNIDAFLSL